jgi:hypothetical protein
VKVIEHVAEHYDVQEVEYGRAYRWCPASIVVECDCGKRSSFKRSDLIASETSCGECGEGMSADIREELLIQLLDENDEATRHPWRYWQPSEDFGLPF